MRNQDSNFSYDGTMKNQPLAIIPLNKVIVSHNVAWLTLPFGGYKFGETPTRDLIPLCAEIRRIPAHRIFEFGTFTGLTTLTMLFNAPHDAEIWTIDINAKMRASMRELNAWNKAIDANDIGKYIKKSRESKRIHQIILNSFELDITPFRASMDFIYIDACHNYRNVMNDTDKAFEMLSPGGSILWHDYPTFPGIKKHLEELPLKRRPARIEGTNIALFRR